MRYTSVAFSSGRANLDLVFAQRAVGAMDALLHLVRAHIMHRRLHGAGWPHATLRTGDGKLLPPPVTCALFTSTGSETEKT